MKGVLYTLKSMSFNGLLREALRRIFGIQYHHRGIPIDSSNTFRIIRNALLRGYDIYGSGDEILIRTSFGEFCVEIADMELLGVLLEPIEEMYGFVDVRGAVVVDIGAYIGETAMFFLSRGAHRVYALEPVDRHYRYLQRNILRNNAMDRVIPMNYGAWFRETALNVNYEGTGTGLRTAAGAPVTIRVRHLSDILREVFRREGRIDLVKMDCEGCEYSLIKLSTEDIRLAKQYIIEIHGSESPIVDRMIEYGYKHKLIKNMARLKTINYFTQ
ncbi:MAG: FkbM family methyltransferase [Nitrososphaerota archaeon]